ncbi:MAG: hypothetical protein ACKVOU_01430 [Cytophagales bacterium]
MFSKKDSFFEVFRLAFNMLIMLLLCVSSLQAHAKKGWSYQWDNGETDVSANNLTPGTHEVTITNDKGCTKTISFNIKEPPAIDVSKVSIETTPTKCYDSRDGTAALKLKASDSTMGFTVLWNNKRGEQKPTKQSETPLAKGL